MANSTPRRVDLTHKVPVRIRSIFNAGRGALMNVSASGAYVATPMYLLPHARVKLQIVLREERRWVEADAVVVWENRGTVERRDGLPPGYGLRFVAVPQDMLQLLERLLMGDGRVAAPEPPPPPPRLAAQPSSADTLAPGAEPPPPPLPSFDAEPEGPPYRLRREHVARHTPESRPGIFVLSYNRTQEARVGRADEDLRATIASYEGEYAYFYCEVVEDLEERYTRECELFHRLGGDRGQLDNDDHPETPPSVELDCPVCVHEKVRR